MRPMPAVQVHRTASHERIPALRGDAAEGEVPEAPYRIAHRIRYRAYETEHYARKNSSPGGSACISAIRWDRIPAGGSPARGVPDVRNASK